MSVDNVLLSLRHTSKSFVAQLAADGAVVYFQHIALAEAPELSLGHMLVDLLVHVRCLFIGRLRLAQPRRSCYDRFRSIVIEAWLVTWWRLRLFFFLPILRS